jgi:hypothetical protein
VVKPAAAKTLADATAGGPPPADGGTAPAAAPALTEAQLAQLRAQDTAGLYQQAEFFARLVDFVPDVANINNQHFSTLSVMNNDGTLSDIYERVLRFSQVMQSKLTDDEKKQIERFRGLLVATSEKTDLITGDKIQVTGASPLVQAYNDKMSAYENTALEYNARRIDAMAADDARSVSYWTVNANILRNRVKAAMADWISSGYKEQYEQIAAYIAQVEGRDLTLLKQRYLDDLEKARLTGIASGSDFFYTSLTPANFSESSGWTKFYFRSGDFSRYSNSSYSASGWKAQAAGGYLGIFGGSGSRSDSSSRTEYNGSFNSDHCAMSFEIAQVPIVRAWMHPSYLSSKTWRFDPGNPDLKTDLLSDGGSPPNGLLPAYPTMAIFIRNLSFDFGHESGFSSYVQQQSSSASGAGGYLSMGPFFLGGSASRSTKNGTTQSNYGYSYTDQGMTVPGMQLCGFKCHILRDKWPNPAPEITAWV